MSILAKPVSYELLDGKNYTFWPITVRMALQLSKMTDISEEEIVSQALTMSVNIKHPEMTKEILMDIIPMGLLPALVDSIGLKNQGDSDEKKVQTNSSPS